jgi:hypothetical protein
VGALGTLATLGTGLAACTDEAEDGTSSAAKACATAGECPSGTVCLVIDGRGACRPVCDGAADECGASASCGGVGVLSVEVCQPPAPAPTPDDPPSAEEQPRLPCASDAECEAIDAGAICAQFQGSRDCTRPCVAETDCDIPTLGGVRTDFLTCLTDEGDATRKACLPDAACFANPMNCISFGGGFPGLP